MGITDKKWNERKQNLTDTINNLGEKFRPTLKAAWKDYIRKKNPADIPRPAPTAFDDTMVVVDDPDDGASAH